MHTASSAVSPRDKTAAGQTSVSVATQKKDGHEKTTLPHGPNALDRVPGLHTKRNKKKATWGLPRVVHVNLYNSVLTPNKI